MILRRLDLPVPGVARVAAAWRGLLARRGVRTGRAGERPAGKPEGGGKVEPPASVPRPAAGPAEEREAAAKETAGPATGGRDLQEALERAKQRARRS